MRSSVTAQSNKKNLAKVIATFLSLVLVFSFFDLAVIPSLAKADDEMVASEEVISDETASPDDGLAPEPVVNDAPVVDASDPVENEQDQNSTKEDDAYVPPSNTPATDGDDEEDNFVDLPSNDEQGTTDEGEETPDDPQASQSIAIRQLYITPSKSRVSVGDEFNAALTIEPFNATYEDIKWTIAEGEATLISPDGKTAKFKADAKGNITIQATVVISSKAGLSDTCITEVTVDDVAVKQVNITGWDKEYLKVGDTGQLTATVEPTNAADKVIEWATSDESILTVDQTGKIEGKKQGDAVITAKASSGAMASVKVRVIECDPVSITLNAFQTTLSLKHSFTISVPTEIDVDLLSLVPGSIDIEKKNYAFTGAVKSGSLKDVSGNSIDNSKYFGYDSVSTIKVSKNGKIEYKSGDTYKSAGDLLVIFGNVYPGSTNTDILDVTMNDWPWDYSDKANSSYQLATAKRVQIYIYDTTDNNKLIYDSGELRYSNSAGYNANDPANSIKNLGGYSFNMLDPLYQVDRVEITKNGSNYQDYGTGDNPAVPESIYVQFNGYKDNYIANPNKATNYLVEHYVIKAYASAAKFKVSYDLNGGSDNGYVFKSEEKIPRNGEQVIVSNGEPTKAGSIFLGWHYDGGIYHAGDTFQMPAKDVVLTAYWEDASTGVTYAMNVADGNSITRTFERIGSVNTLSGSTASKASNYEFIGWFKQDDMEGVLPKSGTSAASIARYFVPTKEQASQDKGYVAVFVTASASVSGGTYTYDGADHGFAVSIDMGPFTSFKAMYSTDGGTSWSTNVPAMQFKDAGTYELQIGFVYPGFIEEPFAKSSIATLTIEKRPVKILVNSVVKAYGSDDAFGGVVENALEAEPLEGVKYGRVEGFEKPLNVGKYEGAITATSYAENENYSVEVVNGDLTIVAADSGLAVKADGVEKTYDAVAASIKAESDSANASLEYSIDQQNWSAENPSFTNAGTYQVYVKAADANYANDAFASSYVTIAPAPATIAVDDAAKTEGEDDPEFTGNVNGMVNDEELEGVEFFREGGHEAAGSYAGVLNARFVENDVSANYNVTTAPGSFTINAADVPATPVPGADDPTPPGDDPVVPVAPVVPVVPGVVPAATVPPVVNPVIDAIMDDPTPLVQAVDEPAEEAIEDDENPLSTFDVPHCWVHWLIILGMIATLIYTIGVVLNRRKTIKDIDDFEKHILGDDAKEKRPSYAHSSSRQHA